jgi:group I intron endonuclease
MPEDQNNNANPNDPLLAEGRSSSNEKLSKRGYTQEIKIIRVYKVTHVPTGKVYIGTTKNTLLMRKRDHYQKSRSGSGHSFQKALKEDSADNFVWEIIDTARTANEAAKLESSYIQYYKSKGGCLNADRGGGLKKKIYQFDVGSGKLIRVYPNLSSAGKAVGVDKKSISKACLGIIKTCGGYVWSYNNSFDLSQCQDARRKKVKQYCTEGKWIGTFNSISKAARLTGVSASSIAKCCRGEYKSAGEYFWKYT